MIRQFFSSFLFVLILFCSCNSKTTDKWKIAKNDSINKYLEIAGNDTIDLKIRNSYNDKAFSLLDLKKNDTLTRYYLSLISYNYMRTKKTKEYIKVSKLHFKKSKQISDTLNLARYYRFKAANFANNFVSDSSFYYYIFAEKLYKKTDDKLGLAIVHINKSDIQFQMNDYLGAELSALNSYYYFKKTNNIQRLPDILNLLGLIYIELEEFEKSFEYFNKLSNIIKNNDIVGEDNINGVFLSNIGFLYQRQKKYKKAIIQYSETLSKIKKIHNFKSLYSNTLDNLVSCKLQIRDYINMEKLLFESLKIRNEIGEPSAIIISLFHVSEYYHLTGDKTLAEKYAKDALDMALKTKKAMDYLLALKQLTIIDSRYVSRYFEEYVQVNDSLQVLERKAKNNFARVQLETNEIKEDKALAIKQKWGVVWVSILIILFITLLLIITKQRQKQKELQFHQSQQKSNEEIYDLMLTQKSKEELIRSTEKTRIAMELHDGVMNRLTSTRLNLNTLNFKKDAATIAKCLTYIEGIYDIEQEIRNIAHNLNTDVFKENSSFIALLENFIMGYKSSTGLKCVFEHDDAIDWSLVSSGIKMNLYRIIQEACHNVDKHADARNIRIDLILCDSNICMSISDDGIGFNVKTNNDGIGLTNIRKRVESLSGELNIKSKKRNTSINITIPFTARS